MGKFEQADVPDDYPVPPDPPPRGSLAYRREVLWIAAAKGSHEYHERMQPFFEHTGWRGVVDMVTEMLWSIAKILPPEARDAYGTPVLHFISPLTEEMMLAEATRVAQTVYGNLPSHQAFKKAADQGAEVARTARECHALMPEVIRELERTGGDIQVGGLPLVRWLNKDPGNRVRNGAMMGYTCHPMLRSVAFPRGDAWVDGYLDGSLNPDPGVIRKVVGSAALIPMQNAARFTYHSPSRRK